MTNMFRILVLSATLGGIALFLVGALTGHAIQGLGFVIVATSMIGWIAVIGIEGGNLVSPKVETPSDGIFKNAS